MFMNIKEIYEFRLLDVHAQFRFWEKKTLPLTLFLNFIYFISFTTIMKQEMTAYTK